MILRVFRWSPGTAGERFDDFPVEPGAGMTVLDALVEIRETRAPDLAFRYACRVGMCGSCAVVVDGRERWACRTRLRAVARGRATVSVRPLYHFPLIRDLVVDMAPFVERMRAVGAAFVPSEESRPPGGGGKGGTTGGAGRPEGRRPEASGRSGDRDSPPSRKSRDAIDAAIECIGCGACLSACTMVRWDPRFPGPAALNRAFTLLADPRDAGPGTRWEALFGEDGVVRCHGQAQCTAVCPMELSPADSILRLRRKAVRSLFLRT